MQPRNVWTEDRFLFPAGRANHSSMPGDTSGYVAESGIPCRWTTALLDEERLRERVPSRVVLKTKRIDDN